MQIAVIGMNQDTAPNHIRNKVAYVESEKIDLTSQLLDEGVREVIILATCGRNEIYICDYNKHMDEVIETVIDRYSAFFDFPDVKDYLYVKIGSKAVEHLFRVASGLDSIVIGEDQILGQVKESHFNALELGASGKILNRLFRDAITISKQIKTELKISEQPMSISYIGVKFLVEKLGDLEKKNILIIGMGKMGRLALVYVNEHNPKHLYMTNRNHDKVVDLKDEYPNIEIIEYDNRKDIFDKVDAIITATASPHHVIRYEDINSDCNLLILDLAMPQDVEEKVNTLDNVILYNVDSLNKISAANESKRLKLSKDAEKIIVKKKDDFLEWMMSIKVDPVIKSLNMLREQVEEDTLDYIYRKLNLAKKEKKIIDKMISSSLKRMIRNPIIKLKSMDDENEIKHYLDVINKLYDFQGE